MSREIPLVEYNSVIWNLTLIYLIDLLENVQRKFSKRIACLSSLSYSDRLAILGLDSLELRRFRFDLINYYKVLNGLSAINAEDHFLIYNPVASSRSSMPYLQKPVKCSSKVSSSFFYRQVDAWNSLPCHLRNCSSLLTFKLDLFQVDLSTS